MPWGRIDDTFHSHPKVLGIARPERAAAVGVFWMAVSWSNAHTTDGVIPAPVLAELCGTPEIAATLVKAKLWHRAGTKGWVVHDFSDYSPTKAAVEEQHRQKAAAGRAGALKRWQDDGRGHDSNGGPIAPAMALVDGTDAPVPYPSPTPTHTAAAKGYPEITAREAERLPAADLEGET